MMVNPTPRWQQLDALWEETHRGRLTLLTYIVLRSFSSGETAGPELRRAISSFLAMSGSVARSALRLSCPLHPSLLWR